MEFDFGSPLNIDLPTVAPVVANKPYRFAYGIHSDAEDPKVSATSFADSIIKIDVTTGTSKVWKDGNHVPGEPIFVARPRTAADGDGELGEDAGVLLTVALDASKGTSALVVIDAESMEEVARAEMTIPFPFGFHVSTYTNYLSMSRVF